MPASSRTIFDVGWFSRSSSELTLDEFHDYVDKHRQDISLTDRYLNRAEEIFAKDSIWQDECDYAKKLVLSARNPLQEFRQLLESTNILPLSVLTLRHQLLITIQQTEEKIQVLSSLIGQFHDICQKSSGRSIRQKQDIARKMQFLRQYIIDILDLTSALFDQVYFRDLCLRMH